MSIGSTSSCLEVHTEVFVSGFITLNMSALLVRGVFGVTFKLGESWRCPKSVAQLLVLKPSSAAHHLTEPVVRRDSSRRNQRLGSLKKKVCLLNESIGNGQSVAHDVLLEV